MRRKLIVFTSLLISLFLIACSAESSNNGNNDNQNTNDDRKNFRVGYVGGTTEFAAIHKAANVFVEHVEEMTDKNIQIEQFPGGQLGGDRDMFESIQNGVLDMGLISVGIMDTFTPNFVGLQLPYLITDKDVEHEIYQSELIQEQLASLEDLNIKGLALVSVGFRSFGSNDKPIKTPEDFKGQKIRAPEGPMLLDAFTHLGMNPTPIPYSDIYTAMQTGVIDGMDQPITQWWAGNYYEVVENVSLMNAYPWPVAIIMNLDTYEALTDEEKEFLQAAAVESQEYMYRSDEVNDMDEKALNLLKEEINVIEDVDPEPFIKVMEPFWDDYAKENDVAKQIIEEVEKITAN